MKETDNLHSFVVSKKMNRAPIFPKEENMKSNELGYDPQIDFSKFLEEARKYATDAKDETIMHSHETTTEAVSHKKMRSWTNTLFFWRKFAKKKGDSHERVSMEASHGSTDVNWRRVSVSGPMHRSKERAGIGHHRVSRPSSGPLAGWFTPTRAEVAEIPYMSLDQQRHIPGGKTFGPIYKVT